MINLIIFGAPGCGKGTQSQLIKEEYGLNHISTGELLREHIRQGTELGKLADTYISDGQLVPDDLIIKMLDDQLSRPEAQNGVIFDGFPRTIPQAHALKEMLERRGRKVDAVIGLEVDDEELTKRLINRGLESGRSDDNPEAIAKRLTVYHNTTRPLQDFYTAEGSYLPIKGTGTIDEIFNNIKAQVNARK